MARVYSFPKSAEQVPIPQGFTLVDLMQGIPSHNDEMVRQGQCYVTGVQFVQRGTSDYDQLIEQMRQQWERLEFTKDRIDAAVSKLREREEIGVVTNFHAARYTNTDGSSMADGCPYQGFFTDLRHIGVIHFDTREVAIAEFGNMKTGSHRNLFYDVKGAKLAGSRWQYGGDIADAVREFHEHGYSLKEVRFPLGTKELVEFNLLRKSKDRRYIPVRSDIKLEDALQIVA